MPDGQGAVLLDAISLRARERALLIGGTGSGKSTLGDVLGADWVNRYGKGRRLILDSKPRYRAQWQANGREAAGRYRSWGHGPTIPGSMVVDTPEQLDLCWQLGYRTAIAQGEGTGDIPRLIATARRFYRQASANRPQLLQVDESLDFFHTNGSPRGGDDVLAQVARAGRERGLGALYGSQRTYGLPGPLLGELTKLYAFRLDWERDAKRFGEMGCPPFPNPLVEHTFRYWTKRDYRRVYGPYRLNLGEAGAA